MLAKDTFFKANRVYLLSGIAAALLLPFLTFEQIRLVEVPAPSQMDYFNPNQDMHIGLVSHQEAVQSTLPIDWMAILLVAYLIGAAIMLIRFISQLLSVRRFIKSGRIISREPYLLIEVDRRITPFSFFNYIVYNPDVQHPSELEMILSHESVHSRQLHSLDVLLMQITLIVQWCNPLAWLYKSSIEQNLEFIADHAAAQKVHSIKDYQHALLKASSTIQPALTTNFYQSFIKKRIVMLNTPKSRKQNLWKLGVILPFLAVFMYSFNVKEVINYVEEEVPESAFAKANKTPVPDNPDARQDVFYINEKSTEEALNSIETYVSTHWDDVRIKFDQRLFTKEGKLSGLSFQTKFSDANFLSNRLSMIAKAPKKLGSYRIKIRTDQEIIISEQGNPKVITITPDNVSIKDPTIALKTEPLMYLATNQANDTLGQNPVEENDELLFTYKRETYSSKDTTETANLARNYNSKHQKGTHSALYEQKSKTNSLRSQNRNALQETYRFLITKNSTPEDLDLLKESLKKNHNASLRITDVTYNEQREITSIRIDFKDAQGNNKNYTVQSSTPISDIYIYREADGSTGIGNAGSSKEAAARIDGLREQMDARRKRMMIDRDSMRATMQERKEDLRARIEKRREDINLRGSALRKQGDSLRYNSTTRTDSSANNRNYGSYNFKSRSQLNANDSVHISRQNANLYPEKSGYIFLDGDTYFYTKNDIGTITYYDRWGTEIKEGEPLYNRLKKAPTFFIKGQNEDDVRQTALTLIRSKSNKTEEPLIIVNGTITTQHAMEQLDPNDIENISVLKGKAAIAAYGQNGKDGVIVIEMKE